MTENFADAEQRTGALVVLLPSAADPITAATSEDQAHLTFVWMGDTKDFPSDDEPELLAGEVAAYAAQLDGPIVVPVRERGLLGKDDADVVFLEPTDALMAARDGLLAESPAISNLHAAAEQYPEWTPHVTLGYPEGVENGPAVGEYDGTEVTFDRLGLWLGGDYTEYPMGGIVDDAITADATVAEVATKEPGIPAEEYVAHDEPEEDEELITEIPVHGVLAPEGIPTGDGRGFRVGSLSSRPISDTRGLPLRLEIVGSHGGNQTSEVVTVGRIDEIFRHEETDTMRFRGAIILSKPYAQQAIDGIIDRSGTGVSIDADAMSVDMESFSEAAMAEAEAEGRDPVTWFSEARVAGLTIVPIGAFHEAYFALGHEFEDEMDPETLAAAAKALEDCGCGEGAAELAGDDATFAPGTHDGPGWITHPVPTARIRRYWVRGKGAAKIKWGVPGDFNRCRSQLAKYVQNPDWLAGLCANMHKEALGVWPGQESGGRHALIASGGKPAPILNLFMDEASLTASAGAEALYPAEFFANPQFTTVTPMHIDKASGRIWGHLAQWNTCHIGISGTCQKPPASTSGYANFLKGVVDTTAGEQRVGTLTYGIGHADPRLRAMAATAHYDKMDAVFAYVNVGSDQYGIWYSGVLKPGLDDDVIDEIRAIGALSGDWRGVGRYGLDLVAAVAVNTPGYPVSVAASAGVQTTAIGLGVVPPEENEAPSGDTKANQEFLAGVVEMVLDRIEVDAETKKRRAELSQRVLAFRRDEIRRRIKEGN